MPRQRVRSRRKVRTRRRHQLQVLAVGLAGAGGVWMVLGGVGILGANWFRSAMAWRIQDIEIVGIPSETQPAIRAALPVRIGDSLWGFSQTQVERNILKQCPSVSRVEIQRRWPARLVLHVQERNAVGWSWKGGARWAVDAAGVLFPVKQPERLTAYPEFVTPASQEDRQLLARFLTAWGRKKDPLQQKLVRCAVDRLSLSGGHEGIALWLEDGTQVFWGSPQEERLGEMQSQLSEVLTDARRRYRGVEYVDLRYQPDRIVVKPKEGHRGST
ncbi:MAG: FtsQ-type POTRA domain-containing protein [Elusimicrobia bacterium]|nr:FtsQ-type POTRA domain-containing protein [Elusimicrobiota bacterium]